MGIRERVAQLLSEMPREPQYPSQGATLFVDLERRETARAFTPLGVTRTLLGGRGANMYYLFRLLDETLTPLDPGHPADLRIGSADRPGAERGARQLHVVVAGIRRAARLPTPAITSRRSSA